MSRYPTYYLQVGAKGEKRLQLLNKQFNPTSLWALDRAGIGEGQSVLDVGCGIGLLTDEMTRRVGPTGRVIGIDYSAEQIQIAKQNAKEANFVELSAENLTELNETFDIVFCRLVLCHLPHAEKVLDEMIACVRPGGHLVIEEVSRLNALFSYPEKKVHTRLATLGTNLMAASDVDKEIGKRLPHLVTQKGLTLVEGRLHLPILKTREQKAWMTMGSEEFAPFAIEAGLISQEEMDEVIDGLREAESDDEWYCTTYEYAQIISQKPARSLDTAS